MKDVLKEQRNQKYNDYVKQVTPVHSLPLNMLKAFVTGGVDLRDRTGNLKLWGYAPDWKKTLQRAGVP